MPSLLVWTVRRQLLAAAGAAHANLVVVRPFAAVLDPIVKANKAHQATQETPQFSFLPS